MLDPNENEYVQRVIARMLDHPSVYMGGPSHQSMSKAASIMRRLSAAGRLVPTTCTHDAWDENVNGIACPTCGMHMNKSDRPEFMFKAAQ